MIDKIPAGALDARFIAPADKCQHCRSPGQLQPPMNTLEYVIYLLRDSEIIDVPIQIRHYDSLNYKRGPATLLDFSAVPSLAGL